MAEYLSPGVYVEEIDAGPKPIEGVSTSTTGAVGVTVRGSSEGKPLLVTSFDEFQRGFGGFHDDPIEQIYNKWDLDAAEGGHWWQFPLAVKAFFENGGKRLYVKRVVSKSAVAAEADLGQGMVSEVTADAKADATALKIRHLIGIQNTSSVQVFTGGATRQKLGDFTVVSYDNDSSTITLDQSLGAGREGRPRLRPDLSHSAPRRRPEHHHALVHGQGPRSLGQ